MRSRHTRWASLRIVTVLSVACCLATSAGAFWTLLETDQAMIARQSELVVIGRIDRVKRSIVSRNGGVYAKCVGTLKIDEVLMGPEGEAVPQEIPVYWGHLRDSTTHIDAWYGLHRRGVWFVERPRSLDEWCLIGPHDALFLPEQEGRTLLAKSGEWPGVRPHVFESDGRWILRVRYHNFTDQPRDAVLWAVEDGELRVPPPYELTVSVSGDGEEIRWVPVLQSVPADPGSTASLPLAPHSYVDRDYAMTGLMDLPADKWPLVELRMSGHADGLAQPYKDAEGSSDWGPIPSPFIIGDVGTPFWLVPSEVSLFWWLVLGGPVLIVHGARLRRRGRPRLGCLCFGAVLGITWAYLLARWGPDAALRAWNVWDSVPGVSPSYGPAVVLGLFLLVVPAAAAVAAILTRRKRHIPGTWLLWLPWLGIPALAGTTIVLICGRYTIL